LIARHWLVLSNVTNTNNYNEHDLFNGILLSECIDNVAVLTNQINQKI